MTNGVLGRSPQLPPSQSSAEAAPPSIQALGPGQYLFDMQDLKVIESIPVDMDQSSGAVAAQWNRDDI